MEDNKSSPVGSLRIEVGLIQDLFDIKLHWDDEKIVQAKRTRASVVELLCMLKSAMPTEPPTMQISASSPSSSTSAQMKGRSSMSSTALRSALDSIRAAEEAAEAGEIESDRGDDARTNFVSPSSMPPPGLGSIGRGPKSRIDNPELQASKLQEALRSILLGGLAGLSYEASSSGDDDVNGGGDGWGVGCSATTDIPWNCTAKLLFEMDDNLNASPLGKMIILQLGSQLASQAARFKHLTRSYGDLQAGHFSQIDQLLNSPAPEERALSPAHFLSNTNLPLSSSSTTSVLGFSLGLGSTTPNTSSLGGATAATTALTTNSSLAALNGQMSVGSETDEKSPDTTSSPGTMLSSLPPRQLLLGLSRSEPTKPALSSIGTAQALAVSGKSGSSGDSCGDSLKNGDQGHPMVSRIGAYNQSTSWEETPAPSARGGAAGTLSSVAATGSQGTERSAASIAFLQPRPEVERPPPFVLQATRSAPVTGSSGLSSQPKPAETMPMTEGITSSLSAPIATEKDVEEDYFLPRVGPASSSAHLQPSEKQPQHSQVGEGYALPPLPPSPSTGSAGYGEAAPAPDAAYPAHPAHPAQAHGYYPGQAMPVAHADGPRSPNLYSSHPGAGGAVVPGASPAYGGVSGNPPQHPPFRDAVPPTPFNHVNATHASPGHGYGPEYNAYYYPSQHSPHPQQYSSPPPLPLPVSALGVLGSHPVLGFGPRGRQGPPRGPKGSSPAKELPPRGLKPEGKTKVPLAGAAATAFITTTAGATGEGGEDGAKKEMFPNRYWRPPKAAATTAATTPNSTVKNIDASPAASSSAATTSAATSTAVDSAATTVAATTTTTTTTPDTISSAPDSDVSSAVSATAVVVTSVASVEDDDKNKAATGSVPPPSATTAGSQVTTTTDSIKAEPMPSSDTSESTSSAAPDRDNDDSKKQHISKQADYEVVGGGKDPVKPSPQSTETPTGNANPNSVENASKEGCKQVETVEAGADATRHKVSAGPAPEKEGMSGKLGSGTGAGEGEGGAEGEGGGREAWTFVFDSPAASAAAATAATAAPPSPSSAVTNSAATAVTTAAAKANTAGESDSGPAATLSTCATSTDHDDGYSGPTTRVGASPAAAATTDASSGASSGTSGTDDITSKAKQSSSMPSSNNTVVATAGGAPPPPNSGKAKSAPIPQRAAGPGPSAKPAPRNIQRQGSQVPYAPHSKQYSPHYPQRLPQHGQYPKYPQHQYSYPPSQGNPRAPPQGPPQGPAYMYAGYGHQPPPPSSGWPTQQHSYHHPHQQPPYPRSNFMPSHGPPPTDPHPHQHPPYQPYQPAGGASFDAYHYADYHPSPAPQPAGNYPPNPSLPRQPHSAPAVGVQPQPEYFDYSTRNTPPSISNIPGTSAHGPSSSYNSTGYMH